MQIPKGLPDTYSTIYTRHTPARILMKRKLFRDSTGTEYYIIGGDKFDSTVWTGETIFGTLTKCPDCSGTVIFSGRYHGRTGRRCLDCGSIFKVTNQR